ncbi:secreted protein, partial [methanotrophic bacterial endosymbiont of Bathymodiolus sp.]
MKKLFTLLTLLTLLLVSFNYVYASEAYKANLNDIASTRESMKSTARIKANREREVPSWK